MNDALIMEFKDRWTALGGLCYITERGDNLGEVFGQAVTELVGGHGSGRVVTALYWTNPGLDLAKWTDPLDFVKFVLWDGTSDMRDTAATADVGITGCAWAVAATGSVALYHTPTAGLLPSVLPPAHLVLIKREDIVATVADGLARVKENLPPLMKIITGPSMTADIEGTLVVGVHGPGQVAALIY